MFFSRSESRRELAGSKRSPKMSRADSNAAALASSKCLVMVSSVCSIPLSSDGSGTGCAGFSARDQKHNLFKVVFRGAVIAVRPIEIAFLGFYEFLADLVLSMPHCSARYTSADNPVSCETARPNSDSDPTFISGRSPGMMVPMRTAIGSMSRIVRSGGVSFSLPCGDRIWLRRITGSCAPVSSINISSTHVSAGTHALSGRYCSTFGMGVRGDNLCAVRSSPSLSAETQHSKSSATLRAEHLSCQSPNDCIE